MWNEQLRGRTGWTHEEFSRIWVSMSVPLVDYFIYVFFPRTVPISGHLFLVRKMRSNLVAYNFEDCRRRIPNYAKKEYRGTDAVAIRSKYILRKLAEESPLFVPIWEDLKDISSDDCGIYLAGMPDPVRLASIQREEPRLYDEFRNPYGIALAGMESAEQYPEGRECLATFRRIQVKQAFEDVKAAFEKTVVSAGNMYEFWESYVLYLLDNGMADWASDVVKVAKTQYPDCLMLDKLMGFCCYELGEWKQAECCLKRFWGANPWDGLAMRTYAGVAFRQKAFSLAAQLYGDCMEHDPLDYCETWNYALALLLARRFEEALSIYRKLDATHGPQPTIFNNMGLALAALGRWQEAVQDCKRALEIDPAHRFAWDTLGFAYLKGAQHEKAIPPLLKAIELEPNYPDAWRHLLHAYQKGGNAERLESAKVYVGRVLPDQLARFEQEKGTNLLD